ncbi:MAG TPA: hypothetical protein VG184_10420 [Acidimicrobiales bacterium]|nr:hypothetical protein [Acidimicrobiales bacterium]
MDRVMRGDPPPERHQDDDWPVPEPDQVTSGDPAHYGGLPGDEPSFDRRAYPKE